MKHKGEQGKAKAAHDPQTYTAQAGSDQDGGQYHGQLQGNHYWLSVNTQGLFIIGNERETADFLSVPHAGAVVHV
ncbi:hypothetical protein GCM10010970_11620 [Silvimonas iriomotensis]|uniref:Uncharacterized protein n=1 Tax=Silvimonas iriomotensis TaxID=449662 RepID=A0ABQ2P6Q5_9NEIS|nr:hypothetical protein GCM10010970_11620 [Silvimonas iriomotensis]